MATFVVSNTGVVTTASTVADSIHVQSAALKASTVNGLGGNDTINLLEAVATDASSLSVYVDAGAGDDSITISSLGAHSAGNATFLGGAGSDTIVASGTSTIGLLKTQNDADLIILSGTSTLESVKLGKGADSVTLETTTVTTVGLGKGHDHFSAASLTLGTAASINLGEGRDTIVIEDMATTLSAATLLGDAAGGSNYGADSIFIDGIQSASTVKGQGGDDTITISGDAADEMLIAGGGQNDVITISGYEDNVTIGGGSGADTLKILETHTITAFFNGGKGADSIHLELSVADDDLTLVHVDGGTGADSITFSANSTVSGAVLPTLQYSAFSESNLSNMDVMTFTLANASGTSLPTIGLDYGVDLSAAVVTERSAIATDGIASTFSGNIAAGIVTLSGAASVSSVTAVAATVDTLTLSDGANEAVIFTTKGGEDYFFVQGGSSGTDDDSIISLGDLSGNGLALTTTNNTAVITFSGG